MDRQINQTDISSLPPETIEKIFEFLTFHERLAASRICKQWRQLAFGPKFIRKMKICIDDRKRRCLSALQDIQVYHKCRNVNVDLYNTEEEIPNVIADLIKTTELNVYCETIEKFLAKHLPCMNALTELCLTVKGNSHFRKRTLRINHPNLKSISLHNQTCSGSFEINCPNLSDLVMDLDDKNSVQVVTQVQHQLRSLDIICSTNWFVQNMTNAKFTSLEKLCVTFSLFYSRIQLSFDSMVNLVELQLHNNLSSNGIIVGEELGVLTRLSKLVISGIAIIAREFTKALLEMVELKDLELDRCESTPSTQLYPISSEHVKNLRMNCTFTNSSFMFPCFTKLTKLHLTKRFDESIGDIFLQLCNAYPELEELRFESTNECKQNEKQKFRSSTTFSQINKLKFLKDLQLVGLELDNIDWTECSSLRIERLQLINCTIQGTGVKQLAESIGDGLYQFSLERCGFRKPRLDMLDTSLNGVEGLRRSLPWCKISFKDCQKLPLVESVKTQSSSTKLF